jgi:hypothetical protein
MNYQEMIAALEAAELFMYDHPGMGAPRQQVVKVRQALEDDLPLEARVKALQERIMALIETNRSLVENLTVVYELLQKNKNKETV